MEMYADIILPLPLTQLYTYRVPEEMQSVLTMGMRVVVNFGARKFYTGIVYALHHHAPEQPNVKPIVLVLDERPVLRPTQLQLWEFVSNYYRSKLGEVYKAAIPSAMKPESETIISINMDQAAQTELTPREMQLLDAMPQEGHISIGDLAKQSNTRSVMGIVTELSAKGVLTMEESLVGKYNARYETCFRLAPTYREESALETLLKEMKRAPKQIAFIEHYLDELGTIEPQQAPLMVRKEFMERHNLSLAIYNALESRGVIETVLRQKDRLSFEQKELHQAAILTPAQQQALEQIKQQFETVETVLLHGVTSSGKTELYMHLIEETLARGEQVLLLVPEIGLTTQLANRLRLVFGSKLGVYHSKFSDQERVEIWNNLLLDKGYEVILGVRSSVFLPFRKLGLVIVDEEHDASYKQQEPSPRYHARNIAQMLGHIHGAKTLLGSATPSIESYTHALTHKYGLVELSERYKGIQMPKIELIDLKECYRKKRMEGHFSLDLIAAMQQALDDNHQIILFQNRRGYSPYVTCKHCGWVPRCNNCDVSLSYHKAFNKLTCHYCGHTISLPTECPVCHSTELTTKGFGTEQVEMEVAELFPEARVARMDLDTTRTRRSYEQLIEEFESHKLDILIGTQMVSKGLDFENVSLIGILNADNLLHFPDFRAYERAFQLLVQVSGRAGRKNMQGKVLIQSSLCDHPLMMQIQCNDFRGFFDLQMAEREKFHYPPYYRLIRIVIKHRDAQVTNNTANVLAQALRTRFGKRVLGPDIPPVGRIQNLFIKQLLLKIEVAASYERAKQILDETVTTQLSQSTDKGIQIYFDVDPM